VTKLRGSRRGTGCRNQQFRKSENLFWVASMSFDSPIKRTISEEEEFRCWSPVFSTFSKIWLVQNLNAIYRLSRVFRFLAWFSGTGVFFRYIFSRYGGSLAFTFALSDVFVLDVYLFPKFVLPLNPEWPESRKAVYICVWFLFKRTKKKSNSLVLYISTPSLLLLSDKNTVEK